VIQVSSPVFDEEVVLPRFGYLRPTTIEIALKALSDYGPEARILAGGTDLLVGMQEGAAAGPSIRYLIDIKRIPELRRIETRDGCLRIGACVTVNELHEYKHLPEGMDALREAASWLGTYQVRNRATVGGNLCNASPACDLGPPLLVLDAHLRVLSPQGERAEPLKGFFACSKQTCLARHDLVTEIVVPVAAGIASGAAKRTRIRGHDLAVVNAAAASSGGGVRVALGAVAPTPLLIHRLEGFGLGQRDEILKIVRESISPIDDVRGSGRYRQYMTEMLVASLLEKLMRKKGRT